MFTVPPIVGLIAFLYIRPQEYWVELQQVPFLYLLLLLCFLGLVVDLRLRLAIPRLAPHLAWAMAFFAWCAVTMAIRDGSTLLNGILSLAVPLALFVSVAQGVQTFRAVQALAASLLVLVLFLAAVGIHQNFAPRGCVLLDPQGVGNASLIQPDGRPCDTNENCTTDDPAQDFLCERVGLFGTSTVGGRVRYRGILQDPNELALALATGLPFAFAFLARRPGRGRQLLLATSFALVAMCTAFTRSRSGQLVFLAAVFVYVLNRYRLRGLFAGVMLAIPVLLFGGRSGGEASQSTEDRLEAMRTGFAMFRGSPLIGVGHGKFTDYHHLTAHNSYILAMAELGFVGLYLWSLVVYVTAKILVLGLFRYWSRPGAEVARDWALALGASFVALLVGNLFLSFTYHPIQWVFLGLAGAYYSAAKRHDPDWQVGVGLFDAILVLMLDLLLVALFYVYFRLKGG
jgi:hypothetical protein